MAIVIGSWGTEGKDCAEVSEGYSAMETAVKEEAYLQSLKIKYKRWGQGASFGLRGTSL